MNWHGLTIGFLLLAAQTVHAAEGLHPEHKTSPSLASDGPGWALQVTPYVWATGLKGDISPFGVGPTVGVDRSFADGRDGVNVAGFLNIWGRHNRSVFSANMMYTDTTDSDVYRFPGTSQLPALDVTGKVDTKQFMGTLQGGYRVLDEPGFTLDALGGIRLWHISNKITASSLGRSESYHESFSWVDPVIGSRLFIDLSDRLSLQVQADVGGFGVSSKFTWSLLSTVNYIFTDNFSVSAGYKVLGVDYRKNGHVYDVRFSGPVLGLTYRF